MLSKAAVAVAVHALVADTVVGEMVHPHMVVALVADAVAAAAKDVALAAEAIATESKAEDALAKSLNLSAVEVATMKKVVI